MMDNLDTQYWPRTAQTASPVHYGIIKDMVHDNVIVHATLARVPNIPITGGGRGIKNIVNTQLATIIYDAGEKQNVTIIGSCEFKIDPSDSSHRMLSRIFHESIYRGIQRNRTVQIYYHRTEHAVWSPSVTARIDAMTVSELFIAANDLAMEVLVPVTEIGKNMLCPSRGMNWQRDQTNIFPAKPVQDHAEDEHEDAPVEED